jgi:hypothetical protein
MECLPVKFKSQVDAEKRFIRKVYMEVVRAGQEAVHVLKIMVFLHSAKDFQSVLKLYGMENCED